MPDPKFIVQMYYGLQFLFLIYIVICLGRQVVSAKIKFVSSLLRLQLFFLKIPVVQTLLREFIFGWQSSFFSRLSGSLRYFSEGDFWTGQTHISLDSLDSTTVLSLSASNQGYITSASLSFSVFPFMDPSGFALIFCLQHLQRTCMMNTYSVSVSGTSRP